MGNVGPSRSGMRVLGWVVGWLDVKFEDFEIIAY